MKQSLASFSDRVNTLDKTEIPRELLLRDPSMRPSPATQQGPEPFHGMHMYVTAAVSLLIAGILSNTVMHACVLIAPGTESPRDRRVIRI
jgi:hypothetical protein